MLPENYCELEHLRKNLLKLGIGYPVKQIKDQKEILVQLDQKAKSDQKEIQDL